MLVKKILILLILKSNKEYSLDEIEQISKISEAELTEILNNLVKDNLLKCRIVNDISNYPQQMLYFYYRKTISANEYLFKNIFKLLTALLVFIYYLKEIFYN